MLIGANVVSKHVIKQKCCADLLAVKVIKLFIFFTNGDVK
jgi:hypothetical protein